MLTLTEEQLVQPASSAPIPPPIASVSEDFVWQDALRTALRTAEDLVKEGYIHEEERPAYEHVLKRYRFLLPRYFASLINKEDPNCPIRLQAIPDLREDHADDWSSDPLDDLGHQPEVKLTHRYRHRLLIHLTPNCTMYCRYCFRKSLLNELSTEMFNGSHRRALDYIAEHQDVEEVIFSGGDPFLAAPAVLEEVLRYLGRTPHIRRVRYHTRVPVTLPMRVTKSLAELLVKSGKPTVVVTHFNHPREITAESRAACELLKQQGITLLNQSVLLRKVNDNVATLESLNMGLFDIGILPYYLHHPDRATGTRHFSMDGERGLRLWKELKERLPGYLVPRYVIDVVGMPYKVDMETYLKPETGGRF